MWSHSRGMQRTKDTLLGKLCARNAPEEVLSCSGFGTNTQPLLLIKSLIGVFNWVLVATLVADPDADVTKPPG